MPNRIIKESICESESVDGLSWFEEVFFYRLIVNCDDYGRMDARAPILRSRLFPLKSVTDKQIEDALKSLRSAGIVDLYVVDGHPYLQMRTWEKHQQIRAKRSKYPSPESTLQADEIICNQMQSNVPVIQSESEYESNTRENAPARVGADRGVLEKYGSLKNVLLSEKEHADLLSRFPDAAERIEVFGAKLAAKGYKYDNHYAAILLWYQQDKKEAGSSSFDVDEFFKAALANTYS